MQSSDKKEEKKKFKINSPFEDISLATTTASTTSVCSHFKSYEDLKDLKFFKHTSYGVDSVAKAIKEDAVEFVEKEDDVVLKLTKKGEKIRRKLEKYKKRGLRT